MSDSSDSAARIRAAFESGRPLAIKGGGSKAFLSPRPDADPESAVIDTSGHSGVVSYEPTELVVTARAGTPISELKKVLAAEGQELPFDPPQFTGSDTLGGVVATAAAGPCAPYRGGVRDFMLGTRIINGRGEVLRFGGEVMKNVAGYDVSRLQVGAWGSLGLLLDVSLKVLPAHESEASRVFEIALSEIADLIQKIERKPLPLQGCSVLPLPVTQQGATGRGRVVMRFAGTEAAVSKAVEETGGEELDDSEAFWSSLRDMKHGFFGLAANSPAADNPSNDASSLWRFTVDPTVAVDDFINNLPHSDGAEPDYLFANGGRVRWIRSTTRGEVMVEHAERFKAGLSQISEGSREFSASFLSDMSGQSAQMSDLQLRIKAAFDPGNILNRGVLPFAPDAASGTGDRSRVRLPKVTALDSAVETGQ